MYKYPYTDAHELNLDWIIERIIKLEGYWSPELADSLVNRMDVVEAEQRSLESLVNGYNSRITTNTNNISSLTNRVVTAESNINAINQREAYADVLNDVNFTVNTDQIRLNTAYVENGVLVMAGTFEPNAPTGIIEGAIVINNVQLRPRRGTILATVAHNASADATVAKFLKFSSTGTSSQNVQAHAGALPWSVSWPVRIS